MNIIDRIQERAFVLRNRLILFSNSFNKAKGKRAIFFFFSEVEQERSGGILSLFFVLDNSKRIFQNYDVYPIVISRYPGITKYDWVDNSFKFWNLYDLKKRLRKYEKILVHVPEGWFSTFCKQWLGARLESLNDKVIINILNQNNDYVPSAAEIEDYKKYFSQITMTLAFHAQEEKVYFLNSEEHLTRHISAWFYKYELQEVGFENKENFVLISPDPNPFKQKIIDIIKKHTKLNVVVIDKIKFEDFVSLQRRAKWAISFGEGYDNYFGGAFLQGGIAFSVYNEQFFPDIFNKSDLPVTIFSSFEEMEEKIIRYFETFDNAVDYSAYSKKVKDIIRGTNSPEMVIEKLKDYYKAIGF